MWDRVFDPRLPYKRLVAYLYVHALVTIFPYIPCKYIKIGHYRPASETPFEWGFGGRLTEARNCVRLVRFVKKHVKVSLQLS